MRSAATCRRPCADACAGPGRNSCRAARARRARPRALGDLLARDAGEGCAHRRNRRRRIEPPAGMLRRARCGSVAARPLHLARGWPRASAGNASMPQVIAAGRTRGGQIWMQSRTLAISPSRRLRRPSRPGGSPECIGLREAVELDDAIAASRRGEEAMRRGQRRRQEVAIGLVEDQPQPAPRAEFGEGARWSRSG